MHKEDIRNLYKGNSDSLHTSLNEKLSEKVVQVIAETVKEVAEGILLEMTPGHKEMMRQHLGDLTIVDLTPKEKDGKGSVMKTQNAACKGKAKDEGRDDYNELGDFKAPKGKKGPNFVAKTYSTNERQLRTEEVERLDELSRGTLNSYVSKSVSSKNNAQLDYLKMGRLTHATKSLSDADKTRNSSFIKNTNDKKQKALNDIQKRETGISRATKKLSEATHEYNKDSVDKAIQSSNRAGRKIGGKEAKLIHSLLKGRTGFKSPKPTTEKK